MVTALTVNEGDVIRIYTGNGAGYGDPRERPRELVHADLRDGLAERGARPGHLRGDMSRAEDPITLEIIQEALQAIGDEMFAMLRKTAMSAIIYEVLDAGTAVTDRRGDLASAGAGIPTFVGVLDKAVKRIIELHDELRPGDVFVTNDPFYGGVTHLNDVILALPVFAGEELIAWTA